MATDKPPKPARSSKPKKPKQQGRARDLGSVRVVTIELDVVLDDAVEAFRQKDRRTKKAIISLALEEYLERRGAWPPVVPAGKPPGG